MATWSEKGVVNIWDTSKHVILLDAPKAGGGASRNNLTGYKETPVCTFSGHKVSIKVWGRGEEVGGGASRGGRLGDGNEEEV